MSLLSATSVTIQQLWAAGSNLCDLIATSYKILLQYDWQALENAQHKMLSNLANITPLQTKKS